MSTLEQQILEEFEDEFRTKNDGLDSDITLKNCQWASVQDFISSALKRQHQADMEEGYKKGLKDGLEKAKSAVPNLVLLNSDGSCFDKGYQAGQENANQATLSNIDKLLSDICQTQ